MVDISVRRDRERLLEILATDGWTVTEGTVASIVDSSRPTEVWIPHATTPAQLNLRPLSEHGVVADALLSNPLDPSVPPGTDGFDGALIETHERIATEATDDCDLLFPVCDGHVIVQFRLPSATPDEKIQTAVQALDRVARDTTALHESLRAVLEEW